MADTPDFDAAAFKRFEHDGWDDVASTYSKTFGQFTQQAAQPLLDATGVSTGTRLLDVACGPGILTAAAGERGAEATGLDYVQSMVDEARTQHPGIEFRQGDAEELPFEDAVFDAVVCNFGILHFPNPERAIAEACRVLTPGGRFSYTAWRPPEESPFMALLMNAVRDYGDMNVSIPAGPPLFRFSDPTQCEQVLSAAGFAEPSFQELPIVARFNDPSQVMNTVDNGMVRAKAMVKGQTPENQRRIEEAIAEGAKAFEKDGAIEISQPALMVSAVKA